jgi:hypothetical protein
LCPASANERDGGFSRGDTLIGDYDTSWMFIKGVVEQQLFFIGMKWKLR